jgi:hypothetical protein
MSMSFWDEFLVGFLANVAAGFIFVAFYFCFQWYLRATDITISYSWTEKGGRCQPNFMICNRSGSRTYLLANVEYRKGEGPAPLDIDNKSIWGKELKPGSIEFFADLAPVKNVMSLAGCMEVKISVRLQNGRRFWLKGQGPGQMSLGLIQRIAFWLRRIVEAGAIPFE